MLEECRFHFEFTGQPGGNYTVLGSTNLVDWEVIGAATEVASGQFEFTAEEEPNRAAYFYEVRCPLGP